MYEVVLTRLLSVICWYYLAFVSISMAMFGMTAGALMVQLRPDWFDQRHISTRLAQAAFATGVSMPVTLIMLLCVPIDLSMAVQTFFSFLLFSSIIAVPFFLRRCCMSLSYADAVSHRAYLFRGSPWGRCRMCSSRPPSQTGGCAKRGSRDFGLAFLERRRLCHLR